MTLVERVARALCRSMGADPDRFGGTWDGGSLDAPAWKSFAGHARDAITAMRDPDDAVICAVEAMAEERYNACPGMLRWYGDDVWNAGIDAALAAEGE